MSVSRLFKKTVALAVAILLIPAAVCMAEVSQGRIKSVAVGVGVLTLDLDKGDIMLVNWDRGTVWERLKSPDELRSGDVLAIDFSRNGDRVLAKKITRFLPNVPAGVRAVSLEEIAGYLDRAGSVPPFTMVDVRPSERYAVAHLVGAMSVPLHRIEKRSIGILPEDRTARLVFYDDGAGDGSAGKAAELAMKAGYANVAVFPDGTAGWERSGRFLASSSAYVRKGKAVIIDLRDPERVAAGHIENAVSIPAANLMASFGLFPLQRWVPLVLYGESDDQALAAARTLRQWGYRYVTIYAGGVKAWVESAEVLTTEKADVAIQTAVDSRGGALRPGDFELALTSKLTVEIVDVRSETEQRKGHFPNSKNIPLGELSSRHGELDRELIQVVFGSDADQAEMAADFLKRKNYRVNFLAGRVEFQGDGKYLVK